jgi:hypothetical protein
MPERFQIDGSPPYVRGLVPNPRMNLDKIYASNARRCSSFRSFIGINCRKFLGLPWLLELGESPEALLSISPHRHGSTHNGSKEAHHGSKEAHRHQ